MAKQPDLPDDNDVAQAGRFSGYQDGQEPVESDYDGNDQPYSKLRPLGRPLSSGVEAGEKISRALRSRLGLVVLRTTPGAGKSQEVRAVVAEHTAADGRTLYFVPTHKLAGQTVTELARLRTHASAPMGVPRVRLPVANERGEVTEESACKYAPAADLLIRSKARIRQDMCPYCSERESYDGVEGSKCPAYAGGGEMAQVTVLQHTLLATMLREHTKRLLGPLPENPEDRGATLIIVDEGLPLTTSTALDGARLTYKRLRSGEMSLTVKGDLEPLLMAVLDGIDRSAKAKEGKPTLREGATLRDILRFAGVEPDDEDGSQRIAWAQRVDGAALWALGTQEALAQRALKDPNDPDVQDHLKRLARMTAFCEAIVDASFHPDRPALRVDEAGGWHLITWARWARYALSYVQAGGRLRWLDATAPLDALRVLWGDIFEVVQVDVADAPGLVVRRYLQWQSAARGKHSIRIKGVTLPKDKEVRGALRRMANLLTEHGAKRAAVLTDKPLALVLTAWLIDHAAGQPAPALVPSELVAWLKGGDLLVGWYGNQRGLDTWKECDAVVTLGDPWPNIGAAEAEARALGLDPEFWCLELTRAELLQAWGRARTVHRTTPVLVVHFGNTTLAPTVDWAPQWFGIETETVRRGAPSTVRPPSNPSTWKADQKARGMTARKHAAFLGITWGTYCRLVPRRPVDAPAASTTVLVGEAEKGSVDVAHKSALDVSEYGSSAVSGTPSLLPICGPLETSTNPRVDEAKVHPEDPAVAHRLSTDRKRARVALVLPPVETAPLVTDSRA